MTYIITLLLLFGFAGCEENNVSRGEPIAYKNIRMNFSAPLYNIDDLEEVDAIFYFNQRTSDFAYHRNMEVFRYYLDLGFPNEVYQDSVDIVVNFYTSKRLIFRVPASNDIYIEWEPDRTGYNNYNDIWLGWNMIDKMELRVFLQERYISAKYHINRELFYFDDFENENEWSVSEYLPRQIIYAHNLKGNNRAWNDNF